MDLQRQQISTSTFPPKQRIGRHEKQKRDRLNRTIFVRVICINVVFQAYDLDLTLNVDEFCCCLFSEDSPVADEKKLKTNSS
jgi:hypothetical protein